MEQISSADVRVPRGGDKVYKDQCIYCFQSPVSRVSRNLVCQFVTKVEYQTLVAFQTLSTVMNYIISMLYYYLITSRIICL